MVGRGMWAAALCFGLLCFGPLGFGAEEAQAQSIGPGPSYVAFSLPWASPGLIRFNRVEGGSLGLRAEGGHGGWLGRATARFGWGDRRPNAAIDLRRPVGAVDLVVRGEARLADLQPFGAPLRLGNTIGSAVLGRDLGEYVRREAVSAGIASRDGRTWLVLMYGEQKPVRPYEDDALFGPDGAGLGRPIVAEGVTAFGAEGQLFRTLGDDPLRPRAQLRIRASTEAGQQAFFGIAARIDARIPVISASRRSHPLVTLRVVAEGGALTSGAPLQRRRALGGATTVRGWDEASTRERSWALGRFELDLHLTPGTIGFFYDRAAHYAPLNSTRTPMRAWGFGVAILDGAIRADWAIPPSNPENGRLELWIGR